MKRAQFQTGFTLIELVVALTISAIVIGMAAMVLTAPTSAYMDTSRRVRQTDSSDAVVRRLGDDLKHALPNSVRINTNGNRAVIEMLVYDAVGFYRRGGELAAGSWSQPERELDDTQNDTRFSLFGRLDPDNASSSYPNHYIAVNNLGNNGTPYDAYASNDYVMTPGRVAIGIQRNANKEESLTITPGFRFRNAGALNSTQRMFFVSGPVTYICNTAANTQTLRRFENYTITSAMPTAETNARLLQSGVSNSLIANNVSACRVRCQGGGGATAAKPCLGGMIVELTINSPTGSANESLRVFEQFPVDNRL